MKNFKSVTLFMAVNWKIKFLAAVGLGFLAVISSVAPVWAQGSDKLMLTITPPLQKINVAPGDIFRGAVKVVNNNKEAITIYAQTLDFKSGEDGGVVFIENSDIVSEKEKSFLLTQWLDIGLEPREILAQQSLEVPYEIRVPDDAGPGGHYAAVLVGTKPPAETVGTSLKISSLLASLIMLNVRGEALERGQIREFSTDRKFYQDEDVYFTVRFENTGTIHLQPRGDIIIYDMRDNEKARLNINHQTEFGNVLPASTRKWSFNWSEGKGLLDMGRYKAVLVLSFGEQGYQTVDQALFFWRVDFGVIALILGGLLFFVLLIFISVRAYIRRAVKAAQEATGLVDPRPAQKSKVVIIPENGGLPDQRAAVKRKSRTGRAEKAGLGWSFLKKTASAALISLLAVSGFILFRLKQEQTAEPWPLNEKGGIIQDKTKPSSAEAEDEAESENAGEHDPADDLGRPFEKAEESEPGEAESPAGPLADDAAPAVFDLPIKPAVKILNGSGRSGAAGEAMALIAAAGYENIITGNADHFDYITTIIKYTAENSHAAEELSRFLPNVVELSETQDQTDEVVIILGKDFK